MNNKFFIDKDELGFDDVSISPIHNNIISRSDVQPYTNYGRMIATPYFITNMSSVGNPKSAKFLSKYKVPVAIHKFVDTKELESLIDSEYGQYTIISVGLDEYSQKHLPLLKKRPFLLIDVPNGYINSFYEYAKKIRQEYPDCWIMAGNVIDRNSAIKLASFGINCVRLGVGKGSVCRTSNKTGIGRKPISTILDCISCNADICWDGGIRQCSDITKSLHAGAKYVSCGRLFAAFTEINQNSPNWAGLLPFYGMSSEEANNKYAGGLKNYRAAEGITDYLDIELNPERLIEDLNGSIRSYMTYCGRKQL